MIRLIYGGPGSGKTTCLTEAIAKDIAAGIPALLLVPEQNTVSVEKRMAEKLSPAAPLSFEVTNFTRLADTVFRRLGGIARRYADAGTESLFLWQVLQQLSPMLHDTRRIDAGRVLSLLSTLREIRAAAVTPKILEETADGLAGDPPLFRKLSDLALILAEYRRLTQESGRALPEEELPELCRLLRENTPLSGYHIYCDDFTSFTPDQLDILAELSRHNDLSVSLALPDPATVAASLCYSELSETDRDLRNRFSSLHIPIEKTLLTGNRRSTSPLAAALGEKLFTLSTAPLPDAIPADGAVRIAECRTPFEEADFIAADIARRVREEGARYRDFMIVAGNAADYRGILDTALAEHGIPAFFSLPVDLSSFEAIKLIRTAYAVWCGGFRREDFITYLKCGFSGIPQEEVDRLELYAERWRLFGTRLSDAPLTMYPDGYGIPRNEKEKKAAADALAVLNRSRDTAVASLRALEPACKGKFTIKKHCEMLYRFFIEIGLEEKLYRRAAQAAADGKTDVQAAARLFPAIADAMDLLCTVIPDVELYAQDFSELLSLQFSARGLGSIPPTADAVLVGSADMLRPGEPKHVYLIGVNADIFPTLPHGSAGFSAAECRKLEEAGLVLCSGEIVFASRALFSFLRAFCAAKESVTLSYFLSDAAFLPLARANVIDRILMLAGNRVELLRTTELPRKNLIECRESGLRALSSRLSPEVGNALRRALLTADPANAARILSAGRPLVEDRSTLAQETAKTLFPREMPMTQSRLEKYISCPFSYYCRYILKLEDDAPAVISPADIGNFIHTVLERFFRDGIPADPSPEAILPRVDAVCREYLSSLFPEGVTPPARIAHLFDRLRSATTRMIAEICDEFSHSLFTPLFFEHELSSNDPSHAAPFRVELPDGGAVLFYGKIDRVDVYRNGEKTYLRVTDYKTGPKSFDLREISTGKNLQMLIYLFAMTGTDRPEFLRSVGATPGNLFPAGVLYLETQPKEATVSSPDDPAVSAALCKRDGLFLHDDDVLFAMDDTEDRRFLPLRFNKDGTVNSADSRRLQTLSDMGQILSTVEETIGRIVTSLRRGVADARVDRNNRYSPCAFCEWKPLCRAAHRSASER